MARLCGNTVVFHGTHQVTHTDWAKSSLHIPRPSPGPCRVCAPMEGPVVPWVTLLGVGCQVGFLPVSPANQSLFAQSWNEADSDLHSHHPSTAIKSSRREERSEKKWDWSAKTRGWLSPEKLLQKPQGVLSASLPSHVRESLTPGPQVLWASRNPAAGAQKDRPHRSCYNTPRLKALRPVLLLRWLPLPVHSKADVTPTM